MINLFLILAFLQSPAHAISSSHVTLYRPANVSASVAEGYLAVLEQLYSSYSTNLQIGTQGKIRVRLCRDKYDFADLTNADSIYSPMWKDGTLFIIARDDISEEGYRSKLAAGVVTGMLSSIRENGAPAWLIAAAAVYESGEYKGVDPPLLGTVKYFSDLEEKMESAQSEEDMSDLLYYLGNTGKFLDGEPGSLMKLLHEFDHFIPLDDAVRNVFHVTLSRLEGEWHEYLENLPGRR